MGAYLPVLDEVRASREMIGEFRGYNRNPRIAANEFSDMRNLTSDYYPVLSPRKRRGRVCQLTKPGGLLAHSGKLCWVDGTAFFYDGQPVPGLTLADGPKRLLAMGAQVLIWPDKVAYNTEDGSVTALGNRRTSTGTVRATLCKLDGEPYESYTAGAVSPADPQDGQLWVDAGSTPHLLRQYSNALGEWVAVPTTYVKISATGIGTGFAEQDGVSVSGMTNGNLNGSFVLYGAGADYIVISALVDAAVTQTQAVTVERQVPDMDYITESENRIWGCSSAKHEIYACALGDPKNWFRFLGVSTDSYVMSVGSGGDFTGCATHLGYVLFFKEEVIHRIYGNKPSNYQLTNISCRGVAKGSEKSLTVVNETLYYKSGHDVCAYNASLPTSISGALGEMRYHDAAAGALGSKYYLSARDGAGNGVMLVYDERRNLWHKEDGVYASHFASLGTELYFINTADNCLYSVNGTLPYAGGQMEGAVEWMAQTGDIGLDSPDNKYVSKLQIRLEAEEGALVRVEVQYGQEAWEEKLRVNFTRTRSFTAPIVPRRCDTMRIRILGRGACRIYSLTKTVEQGSEM